MLTERFLLKDQKVLLPKEQLLKALHMEYEETDEDVQRVLALREEALAVANPKAVYGVAPIEERGEGYIVAGGVKLTSELLCKNVSQVGRIFPYVATCGLEAEEWSKGLTDFLEQFWAETIKQMLMGEVRQLMADQVRKTYVPEGNLSVMSPGSLKEWPLPQQGPLFELIGGVTEELGVTLTESFLMLPFKSVSGFFFCSEKKYENCQLCPILDCPGRRAPYDPESLS